MSSEMPDKDTPGLQEKLKAIGFEKTSFEPKTFNRFIVYIDGIPAYTIKRITLPAYSKDSGWNTYPIRMDLYTPLEANLEQTVANLVGEGSVKIQIKILDPHGEVVTTWDIVAADGKFTMDTLDWSDDGKPALIHLTFYAVTNVEISYP